MSATGDLSKPVELRLYDHCLGASDPSGHLLEHGAFPPGWVQRFDELLAQARARWGSEPSIPKTLAAALFFASFFPEYRYEANRAHREMGNQQTERDLAHLRSVSSLFMFEGLPRPG